MGGGRGLQLVHGETSLIASQYATIICLWIHHPLRHISTLIFIPKNELWYGVQPLKSTWNPNMDPLGIHRNNYHLPDISRYQSWFQNSDSFTPLSESPTLVQAKTFLGGNGRGSPRSSNPWRQTKPAPGLTRHHDVMNPFPSYYIHIIHLQSFTYPSETMVECTGWSTESPFWRCRKTSHHWTCLTTLGTDGKNCWMSSKMWEKYGKMLSST